MGTSDTCFDMRVTVKGEKPSYDDSIARNTCSSDCAFLPQYQIPGGQRIHEAENWTFHNGGPIDPKLRESTKSLNSINPKTKTLDHMLYLPCDWSLLKRSC